MVEIMQAVHSVNWFELMTRAERHEIAHWQLLSQASDAIYSSAAEAVAEEDGLTRPA